MNFQNLPSIIVMKILKVQLLPSYSKWKIANKHFGDPKDCLEFVVLAISNIIGGLIISVFYTLY